MNDRAVPRSHRTTGPSPSLGHHPARRSLLRRGLGGVGATFPGFGATRFGAGLATVAARGGAVVALVAGTAPASAHHGFAGRYDFSTPLYLAGRLESVWLGFPHARLTVLPDADLRLPRARDRYRALEDAEGRSMLSRLRLLAHVGRVELSLDASMTRALIDVPSDLPERSWTEMIVYRRLGNDEYRHELLAVLVRLADGRMLVGSGQAAAEQASVR